MTVFVAASLCHLLEGQNQQIAIWKYGCWQNAVLNFMKWREKQIQLLKKKKKKIRFNYFKGLRVFKRG